MNIPSDLKYTNEHEWVRLKDERFAVIGITDFAQKELGDIVYVEVETLSEHLEQNAVFGTIEAVKTVSDLFLPIAGEVVTVNPALADNPELVNSDPYGQGWIIEVEMKDPASWNDLLDASAYKELIA